MIDVEGDVKGTIGEYHRLVRSLGCNKKAGWASYVEQDSKQSSSRASEPAPALHILPCLNSWPEFFQWQTEV